MVCQVCFAKWLSQHSHSLHCHFYFALLFYQVLSLQFVKSALSNGSVYTVILLFGYFARLSLSLCQLRFEKNGRTSQPVV
jgi:hypothetical protein